MVVEDGKMERSSDKPLVDILKGTIEEQKRINKRNFLLLVILMLMLIITNGCWFVYEYKMADVSAKAESNLIQDATNASSSTNNFASQEVNMDGETGTACDVR